MDERVGESGMKLLFNKNQGDINGDSEKTSEVSRRKFLKIVGMSAGSVAAVGAGIELIPYRAWADSNPNGWGGNSGVSGMSAATMGSGQEVGNHQWAMVIDLRNCDGCKSCTAACQKAHYLTEDQTWIRVFEMGDSQGNSYFMPRPCMQCENPPCLDVCPVHATFRTDQGVVLVNQGRCIGCRMCMAACPYQARYFNWKAGAKYPDTGVFPTLKFPVPQRLGTVGKCTFCVGNLNHGLMSECASACPMGTIYNGDMITDVAINSMGNTVKLSKFLYDNDAVAYKDENNTHPRVWYIPGHGQNLDTNATTG
ncbi:MAG: 4Fe-4S dicluster domain-containing protein [Acidimicrobiales bacterium]|nr:4Fe-4S dicluster domain-containing protein [Acidimicrobiales bacterium]